MRIFCLLAALSSAAWPLAAQGHDSTTGVAHGPSEWFRDPRSALLAQASSENRVRIGDRMVRTNRPPQATMFDAFAPKVSVRWDERTLFVESHGLPAHSMMVGITAWQQQVPLPQNYTGANAWQIPLTPVPAKAPLSIKGRFLRGAIALAANGIPIFNPQNNRGEISAEIGELDQWGGHCGRADDYHYHAAPLHLQGVLGPAQPIAYALDGYAIFGLAEPDGSPPGQLDAFNGHTTTMVGYHYHASTKYPYINGGFHGEVVERDGQVDPQPRAQPVRPDLPPMRGAKIKRLTVAPDERQFSLTYEVAGKEGAVNYALTREGSWNFEFVQTDGTRRGATYAAGESEPRRGPPRDRPPTNESASAIGLDELKVPSPTFVLSSPEIGADGKLPLDYTGDGSGATLPLAWHGAPAGTRSYALVMDHLAPGGVVKSYWVMWDIPAASTSLPKNVKGVGRVGASFKGQTGYEPPKSQGPGPKTYVLTVYALSAAPSITQPPPEVTREILLTALRGKVLASASLSVVHTRTAAGEAPPPR